MQFPQMWILVVLSTVMVIFIFFAWQFLSGNLPPAEWMSFMPWVVKVALWGSFEFASEDLIGFPSLRVIFMLMSWFGIKRNPNKVVITWTLTLLLPSMLPFLKCLSPLATINCLNTTLTYTLVFCCRLAWLSTGSVVFLLIFFSEYARCYHWVIWILLPNYTSISTEGRQRASSLAECAWLAESPGIMVGGNELSR